MTAPRFETLESTLAPLLIDNVDTDQIIPAEFLKTTSRDGLGRGLFAGWRGKPMGDRPFVLDDPRFEGAQVLLAGDNFGCGSSREHAPWALLEYGFRTVISTRFADIFRLNALRNGLLTVTVDPEVHRRLCVAVEGAPESRVRIDLRAQRIEAPWGESFDFPIDPFARRCLLDGVDALGYLDQHAPAIDAWESRNPAAIDTRRLEGVSR